MTEKEEKFYLGIKALFVNKEREFLVVKVNPHKFIPPRDNLWDLPGGRVDKGELPQEALSREIYEELNVVNFQILRHLGMVLSQIRISSGEGDAGLILSLYLCSLPENAEIILDEETSELRWVTAETASELLASKFPPEALSIIRSV